jgi:hypothetical protein
MNKFQFNPKQGGKSAKFSTIPDQEYLDAIKKPIRTGPYKETSDCYIKHRKLEKYLSVDSKGWLEISETKHRWKVYWEEEKGENNFFLQSRENGKYKGYYVGHQFKSDRAGVFFARIDSDWLELDGGMFFNPKTDFKYLANHKKNGKLYWVHRDNSQSNAYGNMTFSMEDA